MDAAERELVITRRWAKAVVNSNGNWRQKWRPVLLRDEGSVDELNALFAKGWYLLELDMDDLPMLVFFAPADTVEAVPRADASDHPRHWNKADLPIVVLRRGKLKSRQKAFLVESDGGYKDMSRLLEREREVGEDQRLIAALALSNNAMVAIFETEHRRTPDDETD